MKGRIELLDEESRKEDKDRMGFKTRKNREERIGLGEVFDLGSEVGTEEAIDGIGGKSGRDRR
jgi:hypothetical protein